MYSYKHRYSYAVDGGLSSWRLGPCSKTCGGGTQEYTRVCDNPKPSCGGKECYGLTFYSHKELCNDFCCPGKVFLVIAIILLVVEVHRTVCQYTMSY